MGFIASVIQLFGATVYGISVIVGVPNALPDESTHVALWDVLYWGTQVCVFEAFGKGYHRVFGVAC